MIHEAPSEEEIRKFYRETLKPVLGKFEKPLGRLAKQLAGGQATIFDELLEQFFSPRK